MRQETISVGCILPAFVTYVEKLVPGGSGPGGSGPRGRGLVPDRGMALPLPL